MNESEVPSEAPPRGAGSASAPPGGRGAAAADVERALLDALPQLVALHDAEGRALWRNRRWSEVTGLAPQELEARADELSPAPDRERLRAAWERGRRTGAPFELELRLCARGGERWYLARAAPVRDGEGRVVHWLATLTDVDRQKRAELSLRQAAERKDQFLAMLGHELRNPLSPIFTALHLIQLRGKNDPYSAEHEIVERQARHLTRLVDDLLDVSRIARGKLQLRPERVELADVVERAIEQVIPLVEQRFHRLHVQVPREGLAVEADPGRLAQVVANLLTNAAKYTEPGGEIRVEATPEEGRRVSLAVRDNGSGIAPEILPHLFELFAQAEQAIEHSAGGLGLGLPIVRNLVELLGGSIEVESQPGRGSTFTVHLPLAEAPAHEPAEPAPPEAVPAPSDRRILVVDDNVDAANLLAHALRGNGHTVRTALDGPSALAVASQLRPHAVVLDLGLPRMDGFELARRLRERFGPSLRLVALTGYGQDRDREQALAAGCDEHLVKPADLDALCRALGGIGAERSPGRPAG